jgi:hypothetical protein
VYVNENGIKVSALSLAWMVYCPQPSFYRERGGLSFTYTWALVVYVNEI